MPTTGWQPQLESSQLVTSVTILFFSHLNNKQSKLVRSVLKYSLCISLSWGCFIIKEGNKFKERAQVFYIINSERMKVNFCNYVK